MRIENDNSLNEKEDQIDKLVCCYYNNVIKKLIS